MNKLLAKINGRLIFIVFWTIGKVMLMAHSIYASMLSMVAPELAKKDSFK